MPENMNTTLDGARYKFIDEYSEENGRILGFCSEMQLKIMIESECLHMDGTFKSCPSLFGQLYIIHGYYRGECMPLCYILMTRRLSSSYSAVFRKLKLCALEIDPRGLNPMMIITDYEAAVMRAVRDEFPHTSHYGCFFHYVQALFRWIKDNHLLAQFNEDRNFRENFVLKTMIALIPSPVIHRVSNEIDIMYPAPESFVNYYQSNWVTKASMITCFPRITTRTNNVSEGYNSAFNSSIGGSKYNLWAFLLKLRTEEKYITIRKERLDYGEPRKAQKIAFIKRNENLVLWKENLLATDDEIDFIYQLRILRRFFGPTQI